MISVVIPYYNRSHTIKRCLLSVLNQDYNNFEIILVDDCSNDWAIADNIINELNSPKIRVIHHDKNKNGSAARNTGIKSANGEFIALLDSDDEWTPIHLSSCLAYKKMLSDSNYLIFASIKVISGTENNIQTAISPSVQYDKIDNASNFLFCENKGISCVTYFLPKKLTLDYLFDETLNRFQDIEYVLRLSFNKIPIFQSAHVGAIVHWEGNTFLNAIRKGANSDFVEEFVTKYEAYFTENAKRRFLNKFLLHLLFYQYRFKKIIIIVYKYKLNKSITLKDIGRFLAYMTIKRSRYLWNILRRI